MFRYLVCCFKATGTIHECIIIFTSIPQNLPKIVTLVMTSQGVVNILVHHILRRKTISDNFLPTLASSFLRAAIIRHIGGKKLLLITSKQGLPRFNSSHSARARAHCRPGRLVFQRYAYLGNVCALDPSQLLSVSPLLRPHPTHKLSTPDTVDNVCRWV